MSLLPLLSINQYAQQAGASDTAGLSGELFPVKEVLNNVHDCIVFTQYWISVTAIKLTSPPSSESSHFAEVIFCTFTAMMIGASSCDTEKQ